MTSVAKKLADKDRRRARAALGVCVRCGRNKSAPGRTSCRACLDRDIATHERAKDRDTPLGTTPRKSAAGRAAGGRDAKLVENATNLHFLRRIDNTLLWTPAKEKAVLPDRRPDNGQAETRP
jgi:hypothetical protein